MHLKSLLLPALLASLTGAYHIAVTDQNSKTVRVFPRDAASWNKDAIYWSWTADGGPWPWTDRSWADISEVKIRKTADRGWVALVATSAGKVGMIDITSKRSTNIDDVDANDVNNLSKIKKSDTTYTVDFAHGVLWDPAGAGSLWALGRNVLTEDGEYIWIRGEKNDMGQYVSFSSEKDPGTATDQRGWSDAEFYKARIYNPEYE
ncbi:predicted protein [Aspergillus terreus NIH2624]|uniref:Uncharacterized protein n=1 Tax=Aspergillus terreus (strain NIH 2624 / FGSC A1156) TaxID=341663 RepID=Q0CZ17_ASPTN|nr:uncharacterized protein ATEG_01067 [Aspergillus terreus NIH2624]EAU37824.1 predicted protein [Aspergillus terreus NIH2624]